jgi:hypothetical protein
LPEPKDNPEIYEIAVGKHFLTSLFKGMRLFFVEGRDKDYYAQLNIANTIFIPAKTRNDVYHKTRSSLEYKGLVDRDFLTKEDIQLIREHYPNLYVLGYYSIENYLYHPDNLAEYYAQKTKPFDKTAYIQKITQAKNELKKRLVGTFSLKRTEYPYFGEAKYDEKDWQHLPNRFKNKGENEAQTEELVESIFSDDFETFYKVLPMKTYCTELPERQHIPKSELAKTLWFMQKMQAVLGA